MFLFFKSVFTNFGAVTFWEKGGEREVGREGEGEGGWRGGPRKGGKGRGNGGEADVGKGEGKRRKREKEKKMKKLEKVICFGRKSLKFTVKASLLSLGGGWFFASLQRITRSNVPAYYKVR